MIHWTDKLAPFSPCSDGLAWARKFPTAQAAWDACEKPDWMCWLLGKVGADKRDLTLLACQFARLVLPLAKGDEAELAIATAEQWAHGDTEVTKEDVRAAWAASYVAASSWAAASTWTADAASTWTADAASRAARTAADAYAAAAMVADWAAAAADARVATLRKCCTIIRSFYPEVPL